MKKPKTINELRQIYANLRKAEENNKNQYQLKKEKLLKIKKLMERLRGRYCNITFTTFEENKETPIDIFYQIWEIVKDEKDEQK